MTNPERILEALRASTSPLDDDERSRRTGVTQRQQVNQIRRRLASQGLLRRVEDPWGKVVNSIACSSTGLASEVGHGEPVRPASSTTLDEGTDEPAGGSSTVQRQAERLILALLGERLRVPLSPRRLSDPMTGASVDVDGGLSGLVRSRGVLGPPRRGQGRAKVQVDQ